MTFKYVQGNTSDKNKGLILFDPDQYDDVAYTLESIGAEDYVLTNSTVWIRTASQSHFNGFKKIFIAKYNTLDRLVVGG